MSGRRLPEPAHGSYRLRCRRPVSRSRVGLAALVAAGLLVAACGDDDGDGGDGLSATTERESSLPEPTGPTATEPGQEPLADIELTLTEVFEADSPTALVARPGTGTLYVAEREGRVREVAVSGEGTDRTYEVADEPLLDISDDVVADVERGLLDVEFSDDGSTLYVHYSLAPEGDTRIDAYTMDGDGLDPSSRREVLAVEQPFANHNGGDIEIGPDGHLYIALGDGGDAGDPEGNGQDTDALLGKILRIDPENPSGGEPYGIPEDNPFADGEGGAPEVWLYGVRNPWRFAFDPDTGDLWVADVGQNEWEEIDLLPADEGGGRGANLGWAAMEGAHEFEGFEGDPPDDTVLPVFEYSHDEGCSITGGLVYRGEGIAGLDGAYLFADYCQGDLRAVRAADGTVTEERTFDAGVGEPVSFGEDGTGEVYVLSLEGPVYRIDAAG